ISGTFGIALSALHYWDRTNLIKPSVRAAAGRGTKRLYSFRDVVQLLVVSRMRGIGLSLQRIRRCLQYLRKHFPEIEAPLAELSLVTDGETVFLLTDDPEQLLDVVKQQFVWALPIAAWLHAARATITEATTPRIEQIEVAGRVFEVEMEQDPEDGWWVGFVDALPGCGSQGKTLDELRYMVADAVRECLIVRGELADYALETAQASAV
ncbi:MAG: MerR family transcriptional regulator, partial [Armatimonadetes bacterium]|nr:MerR family transcriptional regulator [Armatimonadota bacterium]